MQKKLHIKKGDTVVVITGNNKGQKGRVLEIIHKNRQSNCRRCEYDEKTYQTQCGISAGWYHRKRSTCTHLKPNAVRSQNQVLQHVLVGD